MRIAKRPAIDAGDTTTKRQRNAEGQTLQDVNFGTEKIRQANHPLINPKVDNPADRLIYHGQAIRKLLPGDVEVSYRMPPFTFFALIGNCGIVATEQDECFLYYSLFPREFILHHFPPRELSRAMQTSNRWREEKKNKENYTACLHEAVARHPHSKDHGLWVEITCQMNSAEAPPQNTLPQPR